MRTAQTQRGRRAGEPRTVPSSLARQRAGSVAALALFLASLGGCSGGTPSTSDEVVLTIGYSAPAGVNVLTARLTRDFLIQSGMDGRGEPMLAKSWSAANDGMSLTIELREDVHFHDGSLFQAADAKASLDHLRTLPDRLERTPILGDIKAVVVEGAHQIRIDLTRSSAQLLVLALGVPIEKPGPAGDRVWSGPFYLESQDREATTLRVHDDYYRGRSGIDKVVIKTYSSERMAWAAMMRSEIDVLFDVPIDAGEFIEADTGVRLFSRDTPYAYALIFNTRRPPFDDYKLRVALSHAVDRQAIIHGPLRGQGSVASGLWASHWVYQGKELNYDYDPVTADRQLADIGLIAPSRVVPSDASFPSRLHFTAIVGEDQDQLEPVALEVQRQLRHVGVDMRLDAKSQEQVAQQVEGSDWDAALLPLNTARSLGRLYRYWHSAGSSAVSGFTGADMALEALRLASTEAEATRAAGTFQQILFDKAPAIFLTNPETTRAVSRRFVVMDEPGRDVIETLWRWRVADDTLTAGTAVN